MRDVPGRFLMTNFDHKTALCRFLVLATLLWSCPFASAERPNILLIVADDMGYGDLGCYGSTQIETPNIDRLAEHGVRCTDGYVSGSVCAPSRAGMLTGRSGSRFGFEHNLSSPDYLRPEFQGIPLAEPLISNRLRDQGYRTGIVGKWHLGESVAGQHPVQRGFDFFFGMLGGGHNYFPTLEKNQLLYNDTKVSEIRKPYLTDWFTQEAMDFIQAQGKASTPDRSAPWFLMLSYNTPHTPMQAKEMDLAHYAHVTNVHRRTYCAMQRCMDTNIGKIVDLLESREELGNTLIVFVSDNGGSVEASFAVNAPLNGTKGTFLEGGIRVPTIYHWPDKFRPQVYNQPVSTLDLMATFVTAAAGTPPAASATVQRGSAKAIYDSIDLTPYFAGKKRDPPHDALFWRMALRGSAVRWGKWKLLRSHNAQEQLFDLDHDISEQHNVIEEFPGVASRIRQLRLEWERSCERNPMFISDPYWGIYNDRLYKKRYLLEQPTSNESAASWNVPPN